MRAQVWAGFSRGLFLGLILGLAVGVAEGLRILQNAPAGRAGAFEAVAYAIVVDALGFGGLLAALGALVGAGLAGRRSQLPDRTVAALYISGATAMAVALGRLLWLFPPRALEPPPEVSAGELATIPLSALVASVVAYPLARVLSRGLLAATPLAILGLLGACTLALVPPAQVFLEARSYASLSRGNAKAVDLSVLEKNLVPDLEASLELALAPGPDASAPHNLLLITVDALRADHLGACGNRRVQTPWMDLLTHYSALSCNTYTQQPQSNPAFASIFTSTYPAVHGVRVHMVDRLSDSFDTLAEILARRGYTTGAILPWTALDPAFSGFHQGFAVYEAYVVNAPETLQNPLTVSLGALYRRITDQVALGGAVEAVLGMREQVEEDIEGRADVTAAAAINWLSASPREPFFLWVHFFDPHYPWTPPEPWDQLYDEGYDGPYDGTMSFVREMEDGIFDPDSRDVQFLRALYASEVSYADHYLGQVLGYAARQGLLDNTMIVVTGDHGESLGERGGPWPGGDYWLHGDDLYSPGIQVPLILHDPRYAREAPRLDAPIQHIDLMPTILELLDIPVPAQAEGRSIVPLLDGREDGRNRFAITTLGDDRATSIVSGEGWKLVVDRKTGAEELYYLPNDPGERLNLFRAFPGRAATLALQLEEWARATEGRALVQGEEEGARG